MIKELHQKLINKEITVTKLISDYFNRIKNQDKELNAFINLNEEQAFKKAQEIDEKIRRGEEIGLLGGIPYAVKDNILVKGLKTTAASKILENYIASYNATVIDKLEKEGAIIMGKTNLDEFAMGSSTENSAFFVTKNPYDLSRVPGGSSGGSAVAVKSEMSVFALGSDTGGSIRQPAAFCGIVGFKPSYGAVSRYGLIAMASSLDVIGPFATSVEDVEIIFHTIKGKDLKDATSHEVPDFTNQEIRLENCTIGIPKEFFVKGLDDEIKNKIEEVINKIKNYSLIKEVSLPQTTSALPCYYIIMPAEVSSNLARYDGIRYSPNPKFQIPNSNLNLHDLYFQTRGQGFGQEVRRRIILGTYVLSKGYYDAYYKKAQKVRRLIVNEFQEVFKEVDFLITPTTPTPPFKIGEKSSDPLAMYLSDIFTVSSNISGVPAINIPIGLTKDNLPIGMQIIGPYNSDLKLLAFAKLIEQILV
ncbi:MAG: Asp-tRNA(Asn)/Glu-tRNA(Gln) amidotransferase subunit GatA [Minisyncoccia bacterium]|jgi:aspartyl-tRNA(Asn)/glutamyl-tRNA(Gln) amidotransferase subunit A